MYTGLYQHVVLDLQKQSCLLSNVIDHRNVFFVIKNDDFGDQKRKWTDPSFTNNNSMYNNASIYSDDNVCKRFRQNKVQQNISLICPNLNLNQLFFVAFLEFLGKRNNWRIENKTISHRGFYILNANIPLGDSTYKISRFYAFVVLNKTMFVISPNKPEHVFRSLTPRVHLFCQMVIMLQLHNADQPIAPLGSHMI